MKILYLEDDSREAREFTPKLQEMGFEPIWESTLDGLRNHLSSVDEFYFGLFDVKITNKEGDRSGIKAASLFIEKHLPVFLLTNYANDGKVLKEAADVGIPPNFIFPKKITEDHVELIRKSILNALESDRYQTLLLQRPEREENISGKVGISEGQGGPRRFVRQNDILYLEANGDRTFIYIRDVDRNEGYSRILFGRPLGLTIRQLGRSFNPLSIVKFGRSDAINLTQIDRLEVAAIYFEGVKNPIGRVGNELETYFATRGWNLRTNH